MSIEFTSSAGKRVSIYRKSTGMPQQKFADLIGVSRSYLGDIEAERSEPSFNFLTAIVENTDVNSDWILTGKGAMRRQESNETANETLDREAMKLLEMLNALPPAEKRDALMVLESKLSAIEQKKQLEALMKEVVELRQKVG